MSEAMTKHLREIAEAEAKAKEFERVKPAAVNAYNKGELSLEGLEEFGQDLQAAQRASGKETQIPAQRSRGTRGR